MPALNVYSATVLDSYESKNSFLQVLYYTLRDLKHVHGAIFMAHCLFKVPINISLNIHVI